MNPSTGRALGVWLVGVFAYIVAVFNRTSLAVAAHAVTERFGVGASVLSLFAVLQLLVYAGAQIPVGLALDRIGSRKMIAVGALVMATGQLTMAFATHAGVAIMARVLVGAGDAMTFISVLRLIPAWFPAGRVPLITQLTALLGQLGQIASAIPLAAVLAGPGWTTAYAGSAAIGVVAAVVIFAVIRNAPADAAPPEPPSSLKWALADLRASFLHPGTRLGLWSHFSTQFSGTVFALLWGFPFMTTGLGYSPRLAASMLTLMVIAAACIGPVLGQLTARYPLRRSNLIFGVLIATVLIWTVLLIWPGPVPFPLLVLLILVLASNGPASAVGFDFARTFNPATRLGGATGIVNMGGFVASLVTILAVGVILDAQTPDGVAYSLGAFKLAFCFQYIGWIFGFLSLRRTRRQTRAGMLAEGTAVDPLHHAMRRHWRGRHPRDSSGRPLR